ncbi:DUF1559 domain-containing protein [uncultured Gimesia sp.]|uniref:DUF1559 family PulG-like putative transporter n=1 Tax=uncultured Gimesia sp. TaxID=1678688 RepID=UPI0026354D98|nr:DUF1559 domain-containing protein [uncultured Gimesia sp.]
MLGAFFYTGVREARNAVRRKEIKQNLTQIGIALEKYHAKQIHEETLSQGITPKAPSPTSIVSTRSQPIAPTSFLDRINLATNRSNSRKNMKQIGLAMYNYHSTYRCFPPGGTETQKGLPYHSWQTSILPFVDQASIYYKINFNKPWSDPQNHKLFKNKGPFYLNPSIKEKVAPDGSALSHFVGNSLLLKKNHSSRFQEILDGKQHTIMAVGRGNHFKAWGDPTSLAEPSQIIGPDKISSFPDGNYALMCDGSVRLIAKDINPSILKALSTPNGGEKIGDY